MLLPEINFFDDMGSNNEKEELTAKLVESILFLDENLRKDGTSEPGWAKAGEFKSRKEKVEEKRLQKIEINIGKMQAEKESTTKRIKDFGRLRKLLFETGKSLELAVLDALRILGFEAHPFDDGESEFDVIFQSNEGRFIGEVEGKDNKAINVDKFRQLAHNIIEDFKREDVETQAKGVLFGNAYRLLPLSEREEPFTKKCISATAANSTALVFTPDLFKVAKYLSENPDSHFATECRKTLLNSVGRVKFPEIPSSGGNPNKTS